ncbi:hypothetical protein THIOSC13_1110004 [uncultured Thiomicrorhabdus sp.]
MQSGIGTGLGNDWRPGYYAPGFASAAQFTGQIEAVCEHERAVDAIQFDAVQNQNREETQVHTAAMGLTMVYRGEDNDFTRRVLEPTDEDESTLNAVILAPRSIMDALNFVYNRFFSRRFENSGNKDYLGKIKSESLVIHHGGRTLNYSIDGELKQAEELTFNIRPQAIHLLNRDYPENAYHQDLKESVRVTGLPKGEAIKDLAMRPLPWIDHADPEEIKETFVTLKENAKSNQPYLVLMVLSTL